MSPFYFGNSSKPLFGVYSPADPAHDKQKALLICPASFHDYMRSHRQLKQLAVNLSRNGIHVLRFDYAGCGDSAGSWEDSNIEEWVDNIELASAELRALAMVDNLSFLGIRLGASLLNRANLNDFPTKRFVFWDPILDGAQYLETLARLQEAMVDDRNRFAVSRRSYLKDHELEFLGYPISSETSMQLRMVNMFSEKCQVDNLLLLYSHNESDYKSYAESIDRIELQRLSQPCHWENNEHIEMQAQVPELPPIFKKFFGLNN